MNDNGIAMIAGPFNGLIGVSEIFSVSTQTALDNTIIIHVFARQMLLCPQFLTGDICYTHILTLYQSGTSRR
jgi:hypothetical protein